MHKSFIHVATYGWTYIRIFHIHSVPFHMECPASLARVVTMCYTHVLNPVSKQLKWKQEIIGEYF